MAMDYSYQHSGRSPHQSFRSHVTERTQPAGFGSQDDISETSSAHQERPSSPALPSVNERLAYLRPSRELLEYYRKKIGEFDSEHDDMVSRLDQYKMTYEEQHRLQWELRQREEEIAELQKALSDMQVYLFQEREHVLRLYSENDRLKIHELEDRKKIHTLLMLSGLTESEVSYFLKEPPAKAIVEQKLPPKLQASLQTEVGRKTAATTIRQKVLAAKEKHEKSKSRLTEEEEKNYRDNQTLQLQVEALQAQLSEQTKLAKEQLDALMEDRRVKTEEAETRRQRDTDKIKMLTEKLHKTQDLLYDSTKDFLNLRYEHRAHEKEWMGDKDRLLRELDMCRQQLNISKDDVLNVSEGALETRQKKDEEIQSLEYQLKQAQKLGDMYREQVIQLEDELARIREEGEVGKELFKERSDKISKRLTLMNQRYQELEKRRYLEVEGYKTDIKQLRQRLKALEKQLYKVTIGFSEDLAGKRPDDVDMRILRNVRRTAAHSKDLVDELKTLKSKVYGLENDLRHL